MSKFCFLVSTAHLVAADIPVHCLRTQVLGKWNFYLSASTDSRTTCGHMTPDIPKDQPDLADFKSAKTINVKLMDPNKALVDNDDGDWTMIYDEGMSIKTEELDLFSFSHFAMPKDNTVHGKKYFESFCGKTEVGWYKEKKTGKFGCFKAERQHSEDAELAFFHLSLLEQEKLGLSKKKFLKTDEKRNEFDRDAYVKSLDHDGIVSDINSQQTAWTAARYSDEFIREKMGQLQLRASKKVGRGIEINAGGVVAVNKEDDEEKEEIEVKKTADGEKDLPKNFNWDNVDGVSWIEPVLDQQDCGSCYAVSSTHMLSARYRVHKNDPKADGFSINFPLYCSDLNQGCSGGYPSLVSMWSRDVGMVPKKCTGAYYTSDTATCKSTLEKHVERQEFEKCVEDSEKEGKLGAVASWNYVGGYYGGCSALKMMQDLYQGGPVAVALEPGMDFMYYSKGIYSSAPVKASVPWVKVDHAVLLIGWGEEKETPYWVVQNSWGNGWGENGCIRMKRGENESGVEFQAVSAQITDGKAKDVLAYTNSILGEKEKDEEEKKIQV